MLTLVDDYSKGIWVLVLSYKFDVVIRIRQLSALIKMKIKHELTDNSMEFYS